MKTLTENKNILKIQDAGIAPCDAERKMNLKDKNKPTEAWLKADEIRTELFAKYEKRVAPDHSVTAFVGFNIQGSPQAILFKGRSLKPAQNFWYASVESRERAVNKFFEDNKKIPKVDTNKIYAVGDVLYSSWGYEQTNIDYYKVIRLLGTTMIEIIEIASKRKNDEGFNDRGICRPLLDDAIGQSMRKSVQPNGYVSLNSFSCAKALQKNDDGSYKNKRWSSYH